MAAWQMCRDGFPATIVVPGGLPSSPQGCLCPPDPFPAGILLPTSFPITAFPAGALAFLAHGKLASALVTFVKADNLVPAYLSRWLLVPLMALFLRREKRMVEAHDVSMEKLISTQCFDGLLVREDGLIARDLRCDARGGRADIGGQKSPTFLCEILDALEETLPRSKRVEFRGVRHGAPTAATRSRSARSCESFSPFRMG